MAEHEACADLVEKTSREQSSGALEGESQLLPLLQGLLEAPETEQTADSGTESGEDQRNGLIAEVQNALEKLSASLRSDSTDVTPERRSSLLQLVTKLQAGLSNSTPTNERRNSSGRFNRRKQRHNRHTVGVSSEELADARRLIEEISLPNSTPLPFETKVTKLQKQKSEGTLPRHGSSSSVSHSNSNSSFKPYLTTSAVKNSTAKPFSSSNSVSGASSLVQTPTTETSESLDLLYHEDLKDASDNRSPLRKQNDQSIIKRFSQSTSLDLSQNVDFKSVQNAVHQAATNKILTDRKSISESTQDSEDEETSTIKAPQYSITQQQTDIHMQHNPMYNKPENQLTHEEKCNRFNTKKLKMKRANTIDIPKPLNFYEDDDDSDSGNENDVQQRRNTYYALRGPIRVSDTQNKNKMPIFEAKTESDKKFLAFINKHNDNNNNSNNNKNTLWSQKTPVWNNKFGNIKNNFENKHQNSAMKFWKTADDSVPSTGYSTFGPKISRRSAKNLQQMFEERQKQSKQQQTLWSGTTANDQQNIVTGSLKLNTKSLDQEKNYKLVPQPLPVNKFSHAPQSAFKPLPKKENQKPDSLVLPTTDIIKTELSVEHNGTSEAPVFLYSPKPLNTPQTDSSSSSPVVSKPWVATAGEHRVLNLAASKFENQPQQEPPLGKPRKFSKELNKVFIPPTLQQSPQTEKYAAPYLTRNSDQKGGSVRKLSGQYDSLSTTKVPDYSTHSTVKYIHPQPDPKNSYTSHYKPQIYQENTYAPSKNYQNNYTAPPQQTYQNQAPQTYQVTSYTQQYPAPVQNSYQYQPHQTYQPPTQEYQTPQQYQQSQHYQPPQVYQPPQQFQPTQQYQSLQQYQPPQQYQQPYVPQSPQYSQPHSQQISNTSEQNGTPIQYYQHVPGNENYKQNSEQQFTSNYQFTPQIQDTLPKQNVPQTPLTNIQNNQSKLNQDKQGTQKPITQKAAPTSNKENTKPKYETQISNESVHEYTAVSSKLMTGPVSQQAVTVGQKGPLTRDGHDMAAALGLKNTLSKVNKFENTVSENADKSPSNSFKYKSNVSPNNSFKYQSQTQVKNIIIPQTEIKNTPISPTSYKSNEINKNQPSSVNKFKPVEESSKSKSVSPKANIVKPVQQKPIHKLEINDEGQSVVTGKMHIPVINAPKIDPKPPNHTQVLSKSDSWNAICMQSQQTPNKPSPRSSPSQGRTVTRSKSSHSLAVPKMYEAGMTKDEMVLKRKTMEAYLTGNKSPQPLAKTSSHENVPAVVKSDVKVVKRSINRLKTSEKSSMHRQSSGLSRSRTLPDIVCPELLDESNVDKAFEDLFKSSS